MSTETRLPGVSDGSIAMSLSDGPYAQSAYAQAGWHGAFAKLDALLA